MASEELLTQHQIELAERLRQRANIRKIVLKLLDYGLLILLAFIFLFPITFMLVASLKPDDRVIADLRSVEQALLPSISDLTLENFAGKNLWGGEELGKHGCELGNTFGSTPIRAATDCEGVFDRLPFERFFFNSLMLTIVGVTVGIFANSLLAYVLARLRWTGRALFTTLIISMIIVPMEALVVPMLIQVNEMSTFLNYLLSAILVVLTGLAWIVLWNVINTSIDRRFPTADMPVVVQSIVTLFFVVLISAPLEYLTVLVIDQALEGGTWLETFHVQILPFIAEPFSIFLFYQFFLGIPKDFDEAAYIDGASRLQIYWRIIMPLSKPVFATVAILKMMFFWSFFLWPLLVTREETHRPLMVGISYFRTEAPVRWGSIMAYATMVIVPVLIVFLIFQRWFLSSMRSSGVKG